MKRHVQHWSDAEEEIIRQHQRQGIPLRQTAEELGRTVKSVKCHRLVMVSQERLLAVEAMERARAAVDKPDPRALAERTRRNALPRRLLGDPIEGYSALDRKTMTLAQAAQVACLHLDEAWYRLRLG